MLHDAACLPHRTNQVQLLPLVSSTRSTIRCDQTPANAVTCTDLGRRLEHVTHLQMWLQALCFRLICIAHQQRIAWHAKAFLQRTESTQQRKPLIGSPVPCTYIQEQPVAAARRASRMRQIPSHARLTPAMTHCSKPGCTSR